MAVVGDQFEDDTSGGEVGENGSGGGEAPELCGCTLSVRQSEDVLSIWNRRGEDGKVTAKIRWVFLELSFIVYELTCWAGKPYGES
jgi:translation initiation factor 4E